MHTFDYKDTPKKLLTPEIVAMLSKLHEFRGKQSLFAKAKPAVLTNLVDIAKVQSTGSSNRIEGIYTSDERLEALVMQKAEPHNRSEQEIAGYREVLATIHENYSYIPLRSSTLLQLHRDLYAFSGQEIGGRYKNTDNVIAETGVDGTERVRFQPVPAYLTPESMEQACQQLNEAMDAGVFDALLLIPMFILDFLCIHPFNDGNGRMSRLLTLLLLYRNDYVVGKYISIEMLIEQSKRTYYEALKSSSAGWHDNANDYGPFVKYYLGIFIKGYNEFMDRVAHLEKMSKPDRVKVLFDKETGKLTKARIAALCPDISITTIERSLKQLLDERYIEKVGKARATGYIKISDRK